MSRIVYLCDWLPPDFGAVGQYAERAACELATERHDVTLVGLTTGSAAGQKQSVGGGSLRIIRVPAKAYDRTRWGERALWTWRTNWRLIRTAWPCLKRCDEIVFTGSPPFLLHFIAPLNLWLRKRLVYRITDFYPECLGAALGRRPLWLRALQYATDFWRRRVAEFEVLGEDQKRRLEGSGIPSARIRLKRYGSPVAVTPETKPLPLPQTLKDRTVLLYSGNWGVAHDTETFIEAYREHHRRGSGRVALWINAIGTGADHVETELAKDGLPFHRSSPVPLDQLAALLVAPDAHLITLKDAFVGYVLPSKVYGCLDSKRPVMYIGSRESDLHLLCSESLSAGNYFQADAGDVERVAQYLEELGHRARSRGSLAGATA